MAALMVFSGPLTGRALAQDTSSLSPVAAPPAAATIVQIAAVTDTLAQLTAAAQIVTPPTASPPLLDESAALLDEEALPPGPLPSPPPPKPAAPPTMAMNHRVHDQLANLAGDTQRPDRYRGGDIGEADWKIVKVKAVGPCQVGRAAWYGGHYIGRRTSSGTRLDQVHATAAHRTLPLNSLVRVTNLDNGRSVVVRITDRGPVSEKLLIDMSPKAADELMMKTAGIVPVSVEQVVEVADDAK